MVEHSHGRSVRRTLLLAPDARNVSAARRLVRDVAAELGAPDWEDPVTLAVSEVVTNAIVHAGTDVTVEVRASARSVRLEVSDGGSQLPAVRDFADVAGTGRGLKLLDEVVDRWGCAVRAAGKTVWFELGEALPTERSAADDAAEQRAHEAAAASVDTAAGGGRLVTLRKVPLLMHLAWQEHAAELLREFLLTAIEDDPGALESHARASEVLSFLAGRIPAPDLPADPHALLLQATEEHITAEELTFPVPAAVADHVRVLDRLLAAALDKARAGELLSLPTQPEIVEMRRWLCGQIAGQVSGAVEIQPWRASTEPRDELAAGTPADRYAHLADVDDCLIAIDHRSVVVAASSAALAALGYASREELVGRRVIAIVPAGFRQAHIAGMTLHAANGRDNLLEVPLSVPMVRADGAEISVRLEVRPERVDADERVFVGRFTPVHDDDASPVERVSVR